MASGGSGGDEVDVIRKLSRHDFPADFLWGGGTATYQIDGAYSEDRKSLCNWDVWTMEKPGKIEDGQNGCVAINHYNRFRDDVKLMKKLGIDCYRFSISWSRLLPGGRLSTGVNLKGIKFYNDLIDALLSEGITPFATLFHFDVPQCLLDEYGAFEESSIVKDFGEYAEVCFFQFGDRVKHWVTMNEALTYTTCGYVGGTFPPGHSSSSTQRTQTLRLVPKLDRALSDRTFIESDTGTEPYIVAHHLLLSHAKAVDIYRRNYQAVQGGKIGIVNTSVWHEPYTYDPKLKIAPDPANVAAAERATDFEWGWFTAPIVTGDYPPVMRDRVGSRLPTFTTEEAKSLKGSFDFIGMNYYTTYLAENDPTPPPPNPTYYTDQGVKIHYKYGDGTPIGKQAASEWLYIVPRGIYGLLKYNAKIYNNPLVYITENGMSEKNEKIPIVQAIKDDYRIEFYLEHLYYLRKAIDDSVNVKGFMLWSLFDNFEWSWGYTVRFGLYLVDYVNDLVRYPKNSAIWYMNFLNKNPPLPLIDREIVEEETVEVLVETDKSAKRKRARN